MTLLAMTERLPDATRLGAVHLSVGDIEASLTVWRDLIGLAVLSQDAGQCRLGAGNRALIVLHEGAMSPAPAIALGLFHVAVHVTSRKELARVASRLQNSGRRYSGQDHLFSESLYVSDADGNGIEIAFDTPDRGRLDIIDGNPSAISNDGRPHSMLEPLDIAELLAEIAEGEKVPALLSDTAFIGHIHFRTKARDQAFAFYTDVVGLVPNINSPSFRFCDMGTQARRHMVAFNTWGGDEVGPLPDGAAGVEYFEIEVPSAAILEKVKVRLDDAGVAVSRMPAGNLAFADPEGNRIRMANQGAL